MLISDWTLFCSHFIDSFDFSTSIKCNPERLTPQPSQCFIPFLLGGRRGSSFWPTTIFTASKRDPSRWQRWENLYSRYGENYLLRIIFQWNIFDWLQVKLSSITSVSLLDKRGFLTICLTLGSIREGRIYLRSENISGENWLKIFHWLKLQEGGGTERLVLVVKGKRWQMSTLSSQRDDIIK